MNKVSIKLCPRWSVNAGRLYFRFIHRRKQYRLATNYYISPNEWDNNKGVIVFCYSSPERKTQLRCISLSVKHELTALRNFVDKQSSFDYNKIVEQYSQIQGKILFGEYIMGIAMEKRLQGAFATGDRYECACRSLLRHRGDKDFDISELNHTIIQEFEQNERQRGISANTIATYMRNLKSAYRRAVSEGIVADTGPFNNISTTVEKSRKRAIDEKSMIALKNLDLSACPAEAFARDVFMLSFYLQGMSFVDIANLKTKDVRNGVLSYNRNKTGTHITIEWLPCMQDIVNIHHKSESEYMLPILRSGLNPEERHRQYLNRLQTINLLLKRVAAKAGIKTNLTTYVARHTWASMAYRKNVPMSHISACMGHSSESITRIYLDTLSTSTLNKTNQRVIGRLMR